MTFYTHFQAEFTYNQRLMIIKKLSFDVVVNLALKVND